MRSAVALAGATCAGLLASERASAQGKVPKAAMKYQDHPNADKKCSNCLQFVPPDACTIVEGKISPDGYCIAWAKKA
ncbi:MAG: hypothetical protein IT518_13555 [Burkholderiales bacterium]|nr:hypothetical protein [Burkholderiales bacterium]